MKKQINVTQSSMPPYKEFMEELYPVWESRWLSNRGNASRKFEGMLKQYLQADHLYLFANGHVALEVALNALYLKGGGGYHYSVYSLQHHSCHCAKRPDACVL